MKQASVGNISISCLEISISHSKHFISVLQTKKEKLYDFHLHMQGLQWQVLKGCRLRSTLCLGIWCVRSLIMQQYCFIFSSGNGDAAYEMFSAFKCFWCRWYTQAHCINRLHVEWMKYFRTQNKNQNYTSSKGKYREGTVKGGLIPLTTGKYLSISRRSSRNTHIIDSLFK